MAEGYIGPDSAVVADYDTCGYYDVGADLATPTEFNTSLDDGIWSNLAIVRNQGRRIDQRRWCPTGDGSALRVKRVGNQSIRLVWRIANDQSHRGWGPFGRPLVGDGGARGRPNKCLDVSPIFEKAHLFGAGGLKRAHIMENPPALIWTEQPSPAQLRKRAEGEGPCPAEEARIRH
jgi:hypothetical protein